MGTRLGTGWVCNRYIDVAICNKTHGQSHFQAHRFETLLLSIEVLL
jgi:hypothetical protein